MGAGAGIFSESLALDVGVLVGIITGFSIIIGLLIQMRTHRIEEVRNRAEEIKAAVLEVINATPEKVVVSPAPLVVEMKKQFATHEDLAVLERRVLALERDTRDIYVLIKKVPLETITLLRQTKGLLA